ncbi:hypothetical protein EON65_25630 [archaeon]|nr:MAG: hypothetical protein EON65_25630 [archaeon]
MYEDVENAPSSSNSHKVTAPTATNALHEGKDGERDVETLETLAAAPSAAEEEEEEEDELGFHNALIWLTIITAFIAVLSEALSDSIQSAADDIGISAVFISAIVLPIVGNAAEHAGAIMFAWKGKVDLALGVAIGSSTQVALCVLPMLVIIGWMINKDLDMDFGAFEASTLFLSVVSVTFAIKDGKSNWLVGTALLTAYLIISVAFWAHKDEDLDS